METKHTSRAFIFDMNGTMIDDMGYHVKVWHDMINRLGGNLSLEQVKVQCYGKNSEMLERIFPGRFSISEKDALEIEKEKYYQQVYQPVMKLIPGLQEYLEKARLNGIRLGIGSAAILFNINFILDGLRIRHFFQSVVGADHVKNSKPDPETFLRCAAELGVDPSNCIVFEDAPKGVEAAMNAGMKCVVLTTMHQKEEFEQYAGVSHFVQDYHDPLLDALLR